VDKSPKGHEIEWIEGDAEDIVTRGEAILSLGNQMIGSAGLLKAIHDGASGQKGLSLDKLKEVTGDVYKDLNLAGERYAPTGPILKDYGNTLSEVQQGLHTIVNDCETYWARYQAKLTSYNDVNVPPPTITIPPAPGTTAPDPQDKIDDAHDDMTAAHNLFIDEADKFDAKYDSWETAFDDAADRIGKATKGGISDGFWDNVDGWVATALKILQIVGLVLAVLCLVIGGPILGIIALVAGLVVLGLTLYQKYRGNASWGDVAWAVVGVIPFAKLGKFAEVGADGTRSLSTGAKGFFGSIVGAGEWGEAGQQFGRGWATFRSGMSFAGNDAPLITKLGKGSLSVLQNIGGDIHGADILGRYMGAGNMAEASEWAAHNPIALIGGHVIDINVKTVILGITGVAGMAQNNHAQADTWEQQLATNK
jgi:hypothetical protein